MQVEEDYGANMYVDDLPIYRNIGEMRSKEAHIFVNYK